MAERVRADDLAMALYCVDTDLGRSGSRDRIAALGPVVRAFASELDVPLTRRRPRRAAPGSR